MGRVSLWLWEGEGFAQEWTFELQALWMAQEEFSRCYGWPVFFCLPAKCVPRACRLIFDSGKTTCIRAILPSLSMTTADPRIWKSGCLKPSYRASESKPRSAYLNISLTDFASRRNVLNALSRGPEFQTNRFRLQTQRFEPQSGRFLWDHPSDELPHSPRSTNVPWVPI